MPLKKIAQKMEPQPPQEQEDVEVGAEQPVLEPSEAQAMEPGWPYQDFVDRAVREFWQELWNTRNLTKPTQEEIRAAAMPILCQALRNRTGHRRHLAAGGIVQHALETGWIKPPFSEACESPNHVEALIQLAHEANWLAEELTLPDHPSIYYNRDVKTNKSVPREVCYIRGEYLSEVFGSKLSENSRIYPSESWRLNIYYSIENRRGEPTVRIHYQRDEGRGWRNFSGIKRYNESLEDLRLANKEIAALKGSGQSRPEIQARIYDIRKSYGLH